jgi:hypothetical protein
MINISKSLIQTSKLLRFKNLINSSCKFFATKKKDGATQSDKEVDKSKKTVKSSSTLGNTESNSSSPALGNVKVIESIPGHRVKKNKIKIRINKRIILY